MPVTFRRDAEGGLAPDEHVDYRLPQGSSMNQVIVGRIGPNNVPLHCHDVEEYWRIKAKHHGTSTSYSSAD